MKSLISCCFLVSRRRDLVLDCDRGTKRAVVRAAYHREEGGDGPRRCTLPSISSFYRLSASWLNKPPTSPVFVSCETAPWYAHSAKSHERSERLSVSSKLTSLGSGLLFFFCFSVNTEIWQRASKRGAQFNWGREGSAKQVYFEMLLQVFREAICSFPRGNQCQSKFVDKELKPSPGKVLFFQSYYTWNSDCRSWQINMYNLAYFCCRCIEGREK